MTAWPLHPDGRRKTMGEMTHVEAVAQTRIAAERLRPELEGEECHCATGYCKKALANGIHPGDFCRMER